MRDFALSLYPQKFYPMQSHNIDKVSQAACNDSFYTLANVVYTGPSVALACVLFAALRFGAPLPYPEEITS